MPHTDPHPLAALLAKLFNHDELRRFASGLADGAALLADLPGPGASLNQLTRALSAA